MEVKKIPVIIDCDPGHDDVMAIMVALANEDRFNILGITTVCGNQTLEKVTTNILKVEDFLNIDIPVAKGYDRPVIRETDVQPKAHGESGLDGPVFPDTIKHQPVDKHAIEFMKDLIMASDEKVTMICLGPLTNMGLVLRTYPYLKDRIAQIVLMGGGIDNGNVLVKAEFNIYHDPDAAKMVFDSGVQVVMAPIEVCYSGSVLLTETDKFIEGGKVSKLAYDIMKFYNRYAIRNGWDRTAIFDMTPVIYLLKPELFEYEVLNVNIETVGEYCRGMTVCDKRGYAYLPKENGKIVLTKVKDREAFVQVLFDALTKLDKKYAD